VRISQDVVDGMAQVRTHLKLNAEVHRSLQVFREGSLIATPSHIALSSEDINRLRRDTSDHIDGQLAYTMVVSCLLIKFTALRQVNGADPAWSKCPVRKFLKNWCYDATHTVMYSLALHTTTMTNALASSGSRSPKDCLRPAAFLDASF